LRPRCLDPFPTRPLPIWLDELDGRPKLPVDDFSQYVDLNGQFHALLVDAADSPVLARQLDRALNLPFALPSGFVMVQAMLPEARSEEHTSELQSRENLVC